MSTTDLATAVDALLSELGWSQAELHRQSGLAESTIIKILRGEGARADTLRKLDRGFTLPPGTMKQLLEEGPPAGSNAADFVIHLESGETVTAEAKGAGESGRSSPADYRSGTTIAFDPTDTAYTEMFAYGTRFATIASGAGLVPLVGLRTNPSRPIAQVLQDGDVVAHIEIKVVHDQEVDARTMQAWTDQLKALQLDASVLHSGAAAIGWFVGEDVEAALDDYSDELEELHDVYGITVAIGEEQLRWALEEIAEQET